MEAKPSRAPLTPHEEAVAFNFFLGSAISQWAHVEAGLFWLASLCFREHEHYYVAVIIFSIDAFYNKLKVVDRLVKAKYRKTAHIKKWTKLFEELDRLSNIRNCLAHYNSTHYPKAKPGRRFALEARIMGRRQPQRVPKPPSGVGDEGKAVGSAQDGLADFGQCNVCLGQL
jgi:hypothetical protein